MSGALNDALKQVQRGRNSIPTRFQEAGALLRGALLEIWSATTSLEDLKSWVRQDKSSQHGQYQRGVIYARHAASSRTREDFSAACRQRSVFVPRPLALLELA